MPATKPRPGGINRLAGLSPRAVGIPIVLRNAVTGESETVYCDAGSADEVAVTIGAVLWKADRRRELRGAETSATLNEQEITLRIWSPLPPAKARGPAKRLVEWWLRFLGSKS